MKPAPPPHSRDAALKDQGCPLLASRGGPLDPASWNRGQGVRATWTTDLSELYAPDNS